MKKTYIAILTAAAGLCSCIEMMDSASQADVVNPLNVSFKVKAVTGFVDADGNGTINTDFPVDGLTVRFTNFEEDAVIETLTDENGIAQTEVAPGNYTISVFGESESEGNTYYLNGSVQNKAITKDITPEQAEASNDFSIAIRPAMVGPLCFSQIFYCGSTNPETQATYFRDQFYEIYNNSADILYLDGIYFANLTPGTATTKLPIWPEADGNNYAYGERVWKFPGNGTEYPLAPGESCIISQFAANHQLDIYNPQSPIDGSSSEFEFNMNNPNFPDQAAYDMQHVFYQGKAEMGSIPQYLTSVFGGAYVIFRVPEGEAWDPVNDENMKTTDLSKPNSNVYYAKIPIKYVLDAVEAVNNESKMNAKRVPGVLDAGITWVGATYCGLGIARKLSTDEEGNPIIREETGTYIYQDTNNSTDDFERGVVPVMRRNGAKMPSWNHTL